LAKSTTAAASAATPISKQATAPATSASTHAPNGYDSQSHAARNKPSVTSAYAESKYTLRLNDRLAYNHLKTGNVSESGSGGLTIASRGINTVDIGIGQDLTYSTKAGSGELRGKLSLDYIHTSGENDLQGTSASG
jgi:hypothetical protein